ncbi:MAG: hypothetical protein WC464_07290 [Bdellovibrionales bacterium]
MKSQSHIAVIAGFLLLVMACGTLWLSNANIMPHTQKIDLVIPDERLPR